MICLFITNCGVQKKPFERQDINFLLKKDKCELSIPNNWVKVYDIHNFLFFTPKIFKDNHINNAVNICRFTNIGEETLQSVADKNIQLFNKNHKITIENITTKTTKFGETIIYRIHQYWNSYHLINELSYFKVEDNVYVFSYKSLPTFFEYYLNDANFIYQTLNINI